MNSRIAPGLFITILTTVGMPGVLWGQAGQLQAPVSLAEAARQARTERKKSPKSTFIWTNDNLPAHGGISIVGQPPENPQAPSAPNSSPAGDSDSAVKAGLDNTGQRTAGSGAEITTRLSRAREKLASLRTDLDLAQRKFKLDQDQFDSNPNRPQDYSGRAALQTEAQYVDQAKQRVSDAEAEVAALERELSSASK